MNVYIFSGLYIAICSLFERFIQSNRSKLIFLVILFVPTFIISSFHGDISQDYGNYRNIFLSIRNMPLFPSIFTFNIEPGYFILNKIVGLFSTEFTAFLTVVSLINLGIYFYLFYNYSNNYSLSLMLLIAIGNYYVSFNLIRQFLASSIVILAILKIEKGFKRYLILILIAASIHQSVLIMILFYPILKLQINKKKDLLIYILIIIFMYFILFNASNIVRIITSFIFESYSTSGAFGMSEGNPPNVVLKPFFLLLYTMVFHKVINFKDIYERVSLNMIIWLLFFTLLSVQIKMFERFTYFFTPYMTAFIPNINAKLSDNRTRRFFDLIIILLCLVYIFVTQGNEIFIWA